VKGGKSEKGENTGVVDRSRLKGGDDTSWENLRNEPPNGLDLERLERKIEEKRLGTKRKLIIMSTE